MGWLGIGLLLCANFAFAEKEEAYQDTIEVTDTFDPFDRNNMFVSELKHFFDCIANNDTPVTSLVEGKPARNVALRAIAN